MSNHRAGPASAALIVTSFDEVTDAVRDVSLGRDIRAQRRDPLVLLGLGEIRGRDFALTSKGAEFDDAWTVYRDEDAARELLPSSLVQLPPTQALVQGLHGRGSVAVSGGLHLLARLGHADPDDPTRFRSFLKLLNEFGIVAYSVKLQTVRVTAEMPQPEEEAGVSVRIVQPERPYSNVRNLREVLRTCREYIWWADPHFAKKGFESLTDEADATKISEIQILSGPDQAGDASKDYKRFHAEMRAPRRRHAASRRSPSSAVTLGIWSLGDRGYNGRAEDRSVSPPV